MRVTRPLLAAAVVLVLTACGGSVEFPVQDGVIEAEVDTSDRAALGALRRLIDESRELWRAQGIDSYEIQYNSLAYWDCRQRATVSVAPGRDTRLTHGPCPEEEGPGVPAYTIDSLFALLAGAVEGDRMAAFVTARFDADLGYPHWVYVDWEADVADEEVGASVVGFRRLG